MRSGTHPMHTDTAHPFSPSRTMPRITHMTQRYACYRTVIPIIILLLVPAALSAQTYTISEFSINACSGGFLDSGGQGASGYQNNENLTSVICSDIPGESISLQWITANLSTAGTAPVDRIRIWDGDNTSAPLIGEYTGTQLQGQIVSASSTNPTGCLTVQFTSNNTGTGVFAASITCYTPCERPTAVAVMGEAAPALVCTGEVVQFNGSGSYAAPGYNIAQYTWVFDDGTTASGATATHSFDEPGEYIVQLNLVDDNNCVNSNLVDLQVLVSTTPSFQGTIQSQEFCFGATVDLDAVVAPTTWTALPEMNFGPPVQLPDLQGVPFTSEVTFTQFDPGQMLLNTNGLLSICASLEHTFIGDLIVSATCPNGQNVIFHQQNGGGTDLGQPGGVTCTEYCWSPTATNGTWVDNAGGGTLPSGTYESLNPMSGFVGCPLNGTWTFTVVDMWAADDGSMCDWQINFDPSLFPDLTEFTPILGSTIDSAGWSGPGVVIDPNDPLHATATPNTPGDYDFTFTVTDNFGCSYDTTVTITIAEPLAVEAGPDIILCNDPEPMAGEVEGGATANCSYTLTLYDSASDGWGGLIGQASVTVVVNGSSNNYTLAAGGQTSFSISVPLGATITISYSGATLLGNNFQNSFTLFNDQGNPVYQSGTSLAGPANGQHYSGTVTCGGGSGLTEYIWSPAAGLTDPTSLTTNVFVSTPTWFYLSAYPAGYPECASIDSVLVGPDPSIDAGEDATITLCASEPAFNMTGALNGTPDSGGTWTNSVGATVPALFNPLTGASGTYTHTVTSPNGCVATAELTITVIPASDPVCCGIPDAGLPAYSCDLTIALTATFGNTANVGTWTGPAGAVFADVHAAQTTVTLPAGGGGTHWFYWTETSAFCNTVDSVQMTLTDAIVPNLVGTDVLCFGYCDGAIVSNATGGNGGLQYAWSNGAAGNSSVTGLCPGQYQVVITDANGCTGTAALTITEPALLEIDAISSLPVTCSGDCDGEVQVMDATAVTYSYDGGVTWDPSPVNSGLCEGIHQVQIRDADGCLGVGTVTVTGPPPVVADFAWGPNPTTIENPYIEFLNTSTGAQHVYWDIAGLMTSGENEPSYTFDYKEPGVYEVCLVAWNFNNCRDSICKNVVIDDILFTYVPNAFTPDGDGHNDVFGMSVNIHVITKFEMMIYDRWGQLVYSATDTGKPWLGSYRNSGEVLATGVYAYRILYEIRGQETAKELMGHVTLLK